MAAILRVVVATWVVSVAALKYAVASTPTECTTGQVNVEVSTPGGELLLKCPSSDTVKPDASGSNIEKVFLEFQGTNQEALTKLCPGATGTVAGQQVTLKFPQLPNTATTFYLLCQNSSTTTCGFGVTVKAPPPEGPHVCAVKGTSVHLEVVGQGGRAQFACGPDLTLKPKDAKKVYKNDCKSEEDLKDMTLTEGSNNFYVLSATKKPSNKDLCYLCETPGSTRQKGMGDTNCAVLITTSGAPGLPAHSTFGFALPCVLALLHLA